MKGTQAHVYGLLYISEQSAIGFPFRLLSLPACDVCTGICTTISLSKNVSCPLQKYPLLVTLPEPYQEIVVVLNYTNFEHNKAKKRIFRNMSQKFLSKKCGK
jgi:hypothetical protein